MVRLIYIDQLVSCRFFFFQVFHFFILLFFFFLFFTVIDVDFLVIGIYNRNLRTFSFYATVAWQTQDASFNNLSLISCSSNHPPWPMSTPRLVCHQDGRREKTTRDAPIMSTITTVQHPGAVLLCRYEDCPSTPPRPFGTATSFSFSACFFIVPFKLLWDKQIINQTCLVSTEIHAKNHGILAQFSCLNVILFTLFFLFSVFTRAVLLALHSDTVLLA